MTTVTKIAGGLIAALGLVGQSGSVFAEAFTPDVVATINSATVADGTLTLAMTFTNVGTDMEERYEIHNKALLVPKVDYETRLTAQGLVLDTFAVPLQLAQGQSEQSTVTLPLPEMPQGAYWLGVTINTRAAEPQGSNPGRPDANPVPEELTAQANNVTAQMTDLGELPALSRPALTGKYDLYHEVENASFSLQGGTASHGSRNILRVMEGEDAVPERELWDNDITARFLFIDPVAGALALGPYTSGTIDKVWTAISWNAERDGEGRNVHVDYYTNAPVVTGLAPGKYVLGVLMNVTDWFTLDSYPHNNLDLTFVNLAARKTLGLPSEVWLNVSQYNTQSISLSYFGGSGDVAWTYEVANQPEWLDVTMQEYPYGRYFSITALDQTPVGEHRLTFTITATPSGGTPVSESTEVIVLKPDGPTAHCRGVGSYEAPLKIDSPEVDVEERAGVRYMTLNFELANSGTRDLMYSFESTSNRVHVVTPEQRVVAPGQHAPMKFTLPLVGLRNPRDESEASSLYLQLQTNVGSRSCSIYFDARSMLNGALQPQ